MELINSAGDIIPIVKEKSDSAPEGWNAAHNYLDQLIESKKPVCYIEPNTATSSYEIPPTLRLKGDDEDTSYLHNWPAPKEMKDREIWHLTDDFSQLRKAATDVSNSVNNAAIKIAIIDTGYQNGHPFLPEKMHLGVSFIEGEEGQPAYDRNSGTLFEQNGHGTATTCILAGGQISLPQSNNGNIIGAIPFAEIIPIRICETVALIRNKAFVDAVRYAIQQGCEVISMSMAGAPSKAWAEVVNLAYENGVVLVTAAGNNWFKGVSKLLPKRVLYPARWQRVIAATGVAADNMPYNMDARLQLKSEGGETMQGNYGPEDAMESAIAAYTPNVIWATLNDTNKLFRLDGGGTSSATPQVAAAAALWIIKHRTAIEHILEKQPEAKWKKVEMVKKALFESADRSFVEYKKFLGNGVMKASDALLIQPDKDVLKAEEAKVSLWGVLDLLGLLLRLKGETSEEIIRKEMFQTEIIQEIVNNSKLFSLLDYGEMEEWQDEDKKLLREELLNSDNISDHLRNYLQQN